MLTMRRVGSALLLGICVLFCSGYAVPLSPDPDNIPNLQFGKKLPVEAALLITEETRNHIFKVQVPGVISREAEFAFGDALEKISLECFAQIFKKITLVRTLEEAKKYKLFIEPKVADCHFRMISEVALAQPSPYSKVIIHARVGSADAIILEVTDDPIKYQSGKFKSPGETMTDALVYSLARVANQIGENASVRKIIER